LALAWLRIRTWLGWGAPPEANRLFGRLMIMAPLWTVVFAAGYSIVRTMLSGYSFGFAITARPFVVIVTGIGVVTSPLWLAGISRLWLAARGAGKPLITAYGRCHTTLLSPSFYFARIGLSTDSAHWYALPLTWDATVMPGSEEFELLVNPVTGYVERLRRLGDAPVELRQRVQDAGAERDAAGHAETDTGKATREQRRELYRIARREGLRWAINPADVLWTAWTFIVGGIVFAPGALIFAAYFLLTYPVQFASGGKEAGIVFLTGLTLLGLAMIAGGLYLLRIWRRLRRLSGDPPMTVEGTVLAWTPYRNLFSSGKGSLVEIQLPDGVRKLFLVPERWEHRIADKGNRVAVTFTPGTGRVLDVKALAYAPNVQG
jgi:hypothetical protein